MRYGNNRGFVLIAILLALLLLVGVGDSRPAVYINPYAYQLPLIQQSVPPSGNQGTCTGAASVYAAELLKLQAQGLQPTYVTPSVTYNQWVNNSDHNMTVDLSPPDSLSVESYYLRYYEKDTSLENFTMMGDEMKKGGNLESDWITPKNFHATYYYPVTSRAALDSTRIWAINGFFNITSGTIDDRWEKIKSEVYQNGIVLLEIKVWSGYYNNGVTSDGYLKEPPAGDSATTHWIAIVGYNDTSDSIYWMNSWGASMWNKVYPPIIGLSKNYFTRGGLMANVPRR